MVVLELKQILEACTTDYYENILQKIRLLNGESQVF